MWDLNWGLVRSEEVLVAVVIRGVQGHGGG